jgi:hypothetical protein
MKKMKRRMKRRSGSSRPVVQGYPVSIGLSGFPQAGVTALGDASGTFHQ